MTTISITLCTFLALLTSGFSEEYIDLTNFLEKRTQQYPLKEHKKIYLSTAPRTGSTLVYNVLRYLFENENHYGYEKHYNNLVIKGHSPFEIKKDGIYIVTIRNPIEACLSVYRTLCSAENKLLPLDCLDSFLQDQAEFIFHINRLIEIGTPVLVLKYEEFTKNLDSLFDSLQQCFNVSIDGRDIDFLKKALYKENVIANIKNFNTFNEFNPFSLFHGSHIDMGEFTKEFADSIRDKLIAKSLEYPCFKKWGYLNSTDFLEHKKPERTPGF